MTRSRLGRLALLLSPLAVMVAAEGCRAPTEVIVMLGSDACDAGLISTTVNVDYVSTLDSVHTVPPPQVQTTSCSADGGIGSMVVIPGPQGNGPFVISVSSSVGHPVNDCSVDGGAANCIYETRQLSLIDNDPITVPIEMLGACIGVVCPPGQTCLPDGTCGSDQISTLCPPGQSTCLTSPDGGTSPGHHVGKDGGEESGATGHPDAGAPRDAGGEASRDAGHDATVNDSGGIQDGGGDTTLLRDTGVDAAPVAAMLASGDHWPLALVVNEGRVYWTTQCLVTNRQVCGADAAVKSMTVEGADIVTVATGQNAPYAIAASGSAVVWTASAGIPHGQNPDPLPDNCNGTLVRSSGGGAPVTLTTKQTIPLGIAIANGTIYWVDNGWTMPTGESGDAGEVASIALDAGLNGTVKYLVTDQAYPGGMASDGTYLYWGVYGSGNGGSILRRAIEGDAAVVTLASGLTSPSNVCTGGGRVVWTALGTGTGNSTVTSAAMDGSAMATIAADQGIVWQCAADDTYVYWTDVSGGTVLKRALDGTGATLTLAHAQSFPANVALDDASVYWTDNGSEAGTSVGSVWKIAK